jgi:hypothetical protein
MGVLRDPFRVFRRDALCSTAAGARATSERAVTRAQLRARRAGQHERQQREPHRAGQHDRSEVSSVFSLVVVMGQVTSMIWTQDNTGAVPERMAHGQPGRQVTSESTRSWAALEPAGERVDPVVGSPRGSAGRVDRAARCPRGSR